MNIIAPRVGGKLRLTGPRIAFVVALVCMTASMIGVAQASAEESYPRFVQKSEPHPPVFPQAFTGTMVETNLVTQTPIVGEKTRSVICKKGTLAGSFTSPQLAKVTIKLKECTLTISGIKAECITGTAGVSHEIELSELAGKLAYGTVEEEGFKYISLSKANLVLRPASGVLLAKIKCVGLWKGVVNGGIVVPITPIDKNVKTFNLSFAQSGYVQSPSEYFNFEEQFVTLKPTCMWEGEAEANCGVQSIALDSLTMTGEEGFIYEK
jgi:hypothetical protein